MNNSASAVARTVPTDLLRRHQTLLEVGEVIHAFRDVNQLFRNLADCLRPLLICDGMAVGLLNDDKTSIRLALAENWGTFPPEIGRSVPLSAVPAEIAIAEQRPVRFSLHNHEQAARYPLHTEVLKMAGWQTSYTFPLSTSLTQLGGIGCLFREDVHLGEQELDFFRRVADQVAVAIENAQNFEKARLAQEQVIWERDRSRLLLEINNAVVSHLDLRELLKSIASSLRRIIPNDAATLILYDPESERIRLQALDLQALEKMPFEEGLEIPMEGTPEGEAIATRRPVLAVPHIDLKRFFSPWAKVGLDNGIKSGCAVPLIAHGHPVGAMSVVSMRENAFNEEDAKLLEQCASQVAIAVSNALAMRDLEALKNKLAQEKLYLEDEIRSEFNFDEIIGHSPALRQVLQLVETVAASDSTVLLLGETGTGKELIARAVHDHSRRKSRTFVKLNCAAIPTGLLESELFGHEKGAFTGAIAQRVGRLELADQGTLFLDEVGDIPIEIQPKLLRALQEREFERLGSTHTKKVNVRLVAATNRDLEKMIEERQFRNDLYYRLNVFPIRIPPLRERKEDIPLLVRYFAEKFARQMQKPIDSIPTETMSKLQRWHWPGNIRELENLIERAVILTIGTALQVPLPEIKPTSLSVPTVASSRAGENNDREHIIKILRETGGMLGGPNGAAARLGIKRTTLQYKIKKLGITRNHWWPPTLQT